MDLVEMLKNVPKGTKLYSPIFGEVTFNKINDKLIHCIEVTINNDSEESFARDGKYNNCCKDGECMLFPSKEQRDWNKFKIDLPIDTPVMVSDTKKHWSLRYYAGNNKVFGNGFKSTDVVTIVSYRHIIPFDKFNPNDIEESLKYNIVEQENNL